MGNPADEFVEVDQTFYSPNTKSDANLYKDFLNVLKREVRIPAIVTKIPSASGTSTVAESFYTVDLYAGGYSAEPSAVDVPMARLVAPLIGIIVNTPVFVRMQGDACIMVEEMYWNWLYVQSEGTKSIGQGTNQGWQSGGPNRLKGWPCDGPGSVPHTSIMMADKKIAINLLYPYLYIDPSVGSSDFTAVGPRFFGAYSTIANNVVVPYRRYDTPIASAPYAGSIPLSIPADPAQIPVYTVGLSMFQSPLPYGQGKYNVLQIIDDSVPGVLGFDQVRFPNPSGVP